MVISRRNEKKKNKCADERKKMLICKNWNRNVLSENVKDVWKRIEKKKNNVRLKLRTETHFILLRSSPIVINVTNQTSPFKGFSNVDELSV